MSLRAIPVRCIAIDHVVAALLPALTPAQRDAYKRRKERGESAPSIIAKMLWWLEAGAPAPGGASEPPSMGARGGAPGGMMGGLSHSHSSHGLGPRGGSSNGASSSGMMHHHQQHGALAGPYGGAQLSASPSGAAQEAAMAAAMTAAAAAVNAVTSAAPPYGLASHFNSMSLGGMAGMGGGMHGGMHGLGAAGALAGFGGARPDVLSHGLRDQVPLSADPMTAYLQSMQSAAAMQSAGLHGGAFMGGGAGGYPGGLGGLMGM